MLIDIIESIETFDTWNKMPFDELLKRLKNEIDLEIEDSQIDFWRYTGLNNVDFIRLMIADLKPFSKTWWYLVGEKANNIYKKSDSYTCEEIAAYSKTRIKNK